MNSLIHGKRLRSVFILTLLMMAFCLFIPRTSARVAPLMVPASVISPPHQSDQTLEAIVAEVMGQQMELSQLPGAQIAIVKDGQLVFAQGYGYADLATQTPVEVETTIFRAGSVSKVVTWTAVMQLVEQGKLDLHADINRYLPHFQIPATFDQPITLHHLLTHTAGFEERDLNGRSIVPDPGDLIPLDEAVARALPTRIYAPGEIVAYCNYCAALAGYIVEEVSGEPFEQYVATHILVPLQMEHSTFVQPVPSVLAETSAIGYTVNDEGETEIAPNRYLPLGPAGILSTTATDMAHFMIAHLEGGRYGAGQLLQPATLQTMHDRHYTFDPRLPGVTWGFFEGERNGLRTLSHGGNIDGFGSWLTLIPTEHLGIYIGFNGQSREHARLAVINAVIDYYIPAPAVPDRTPLPDFAARAGTFTADFRTTRHSETTVQKLFSYLVPTTTVVASPDRSLSIEGSGPGLTNQDGTPKRWVEIEPMLFQEVGGQATLAFRTNEGGQVTAFVVSTFPFVAYERLAWYDQPQIQLGGIMVVLLVQLVTGGIWLFGFIKGRIRRHSDTRTNLQRHTHRLAGAVIGVNLLLVVSVMGWLVTDDISYRIPPFFYATAILGFFSVVGTLAMILSAILLWHRRTGYLGGRLHYTLLTLTAIGVVVFLFYNRLLGLQI